jgi:MFS superfamily sulfate permease-like transporter
MTRLRRLPAAIALAAVTAASAIACTPVTEATVPAPPSCPSGQQWTALPSGHWGCAPDNGGKP